MLPKPSKEEVWKDIVDEIYLGVFNRGVEAKHTIEHIRYITKKFSSISYTKQFVWIVEVISER